MVLLTPIYKSPGDITSRSSDVGPVELCACALQLLCTFLKCCSRHEHGPHDMAITLQAGSYPLMSTPTHPPSRPLGPPHASLECQFSISCLPEQEGHYSCGGRGLGIIGGFSSLLRYRLVYSSRECRN
jgi:hypothetical protein